MSEAVSFHAVPHEPPAPLWAMTDLHLYLLPSGEKVTLRGTFRAMPKWSTPAVWTGAGSASTARGSPVTVTCWP